MKKILSIALALSLCLSLTACGNGGQSGGQDQSSASGSSGQGAGSSTSDETTQSDLAYIQNKGTLVVGITEFEPMDYQDADGNWIGFDADLARAFAESLGVEAQFQLIDWDNKVFELDGHTIDVVWNGMTLTDEVMAAIDCSTAYCNNAQIVILPADVAEDYRDVESLAGLSFAVEPGSAGQAQAEENGVT